MSDMKLAA